MIWSLNMDDFKGECSNTRPNSITGKNRFPLVAKVKDVLEDDQL